MADPGPVESLGMNAFGSIYRGKRVLLTGHTGFKGSWLALWLTRLGAQVTGVALAPQTQPSHWRLLELDMPSWLQDLRDAQALRERVSEARPDIVFHLAAQPLVRRSYREPLETWSTNVLGTANLLEACRDVDSLRAVVVVTSDKCYDNREWCWGYRETDALGGHDPYSASKAATELLVASYRSSFFQASGRALLATARAGNVIGGGDWSEDRIVPDLVRAVAAGQELRIRSPRATRPWQHVLEPLAGYLLLGADLLQGRSERAQAWNFGPYTEGNRSVEQLLEVFATRWPEVRWALEGGGTPLHEAGLLYLDSAKAHRELGWQPVWNFEQAVGHTVDWYRAHAEHGRVRSAEQIDAYVDDARRAGAAWSA